MPRESQYRQYTALLVSGLVFTVFVQYVLVRSVLAHWNPEGQEITTDPRCVRGGGDGGDGPVCG